MFVSWGCGQLRASGWGRHIILIGEVKGWGWEMEKGRNAGLTAAHSTVLRLAGFLLQSARMVAQEGSLWSTVVSIG